MELVDVETSNKLKEAVDGWSQRYLDGRGLTVATQEARVWKRIVCSYHWI